MRCDTHCSNSVSSKDKYKEITFYAHKLIIQYTQQVLIWFLILEA